MFERIFQNIKLPSKSKDGTERHRKIKGLLLFLAKERSANVALNKLLAIFPEKERLKLKSRVLASMSVYQGADCEVVSKEFSTAEGKSLPSWFQEEYHSASLLPWTLGIAASRKFFLSCQVCHLLSNRPTNVTSGGIPKPSFSTLISFASVPATRGYSHLFRLFQGAGVLVHQVGQRRTQYPFQCCKPGGRARPGWRRWLLFVVRTHHWLHLKP